ncbi:MAG TPA: molybdate ABC transporter substrate-binding protein [Pyrinomonadaceae bacterium]|nr:molybdate ABC transporter substrate-binding protein [Pyrinomonadaceae bacterium]
MVAEPPIFKHSLPVIARANFPHPLSLLITFSVILASSLGCSRGAPDERQGASPEITVAAAANLTDAFGELGKEFTARTGIRVTFSFGATADLARQIENGAPFDVFAAADVEHVERLNNLGLVTPGTNKIYARGRLVLWVPPASNLAVNRLEEIARPEVERIALAKPDVAPYGRAAVEALRALGLWAQVEPKVIYGQNVSQAKQYAATGNAEVAFIPRALVRPGEGRFVEVDERLHQPINQALAVVKDSPHHDAAQAFATYVLSPEGQALLERYGYTRAVSADR